MKHIRVYGLFLIFIFAMPFFLTAVPMESILKENELPAKETIEWTDDETIPILNLLPDVAGSDYVREAFFSFRPEVTVQRLYRMEAEALDQLSTQEVLLHMVNILCDTDSQTGYKYRSHRRDKRIELIEESYRVNEDDDKIDDLEFYSLSQLDTEDLPTGPEGGNSSNIIGHIRFRQHIKEANFRGAVFRQNIYVGESWIRFTSTNEDRLWVKIVPLMKPEGLRNEFFMFEHEGAWYIFGSSQIEDRPTLNQLFGEPVHLPSLYRKRMDVYKAWMRDQLEERIK